MERVLMKKTDDQYETIAAWDRVWCASIHRPKGWSPYPPKSNHGVSLLMITLLTKKYRSNVRFLLKSKTLLRMYGSQGGKSYPGPIEFSSWSPHRSGDLYSELAENYVLYCMYCTHVKSSKKHRSPESFFFPATTLFNRGDYIHSLSLENNAKRKHSSKRHMTAATLGSAYVVQVLSLTP